MYVHVQVHTYIRTVQVLYIHIYRQRRAVWSDHPVSFPLQLYTNVRLCKFCPVAHFVVFWSQRFPKYGSISCPVEWAYVYVKIKRLRIDRHDTYNTFSYKHEILSEIYSCYDIHSPINQQQYLRSSGPSITRLNQFFKKGVLKLFIKAEKKQICMYVLRTYILTYPLGTSTYLYVGLYVRSSTTYIALSLER